MSAEPTSDEDFYKGNLSRPIYIAMGVYMSIAGLASYIGNGFILFIFIKNRLFRKANISLFVLNIVIANLGESLLGFPFAIISHFSARWVFRPIGCSFYGFICYLCSLTAVSTFIAMSLFQYMRVCKSLLLQRLFTPGRIPKIVAAIWVYSLVWSIMPFLGFGKYGPEPFKTTCSLAWTDKDPSSKVYVILVGVCVLAVPVAIMMAAYYKIIRRTYRQLSGGSVQGEGFRFPVDHPLHGVNRVSGIEPRTTKIVFITVVMYLVAWMPYGVMSLVSACGVHIPVALTTLPTMFAKSQCAYNPIIYFVAHLRYRVSMQELFRFPYPNSTDTPEARTGHRLQEITKAGIH